MGKFGIGARVRDRDGDEGFIVEKRKGARRVRYDSIIHGTVGLKAWVEKSFLTPIPANATPDWQPKVGDRVRVTYGHGWDGDGEVVRAGGYTASVRLDDGVFAGCIGAFPLRYLEPLPVAAEAQGAGNLEDDVTAIFDALEAWLGEDIPVAVPPVAVPPVAVAPATATPAGKFKVGDHIRVKGGTLTGTIATRSPAGAMSFVTDGDTMAGPEFWFDDELELVEPTLRPGTFANLRVKVTNVRGKQANVIIPGLRNPSHGVPLSALSA